AAMVGGFVVGGLPNWIVTGHERGGDWGNLLFSAWDYLLREFPRGFLEGLWALSGGRIPLLLAWFAGLAVSGVLCARLWLLTRNGGKGSVPVTLCTVVGVAFWALVVLIVAGGRTVYFGHLYPSIVVLFGVMMG